MIQTRGQSHPRGARARSQSVFERIRTARGFTLIEVVTVVIILSILALVTVTRSDSAGEAARVEATLEELDALARAISGDPRQTAHGERTDFGYIGDIGAQPSGLADLMINPGLATWRGPYLSAERPSDVLTDSWGAPYAYSGVAIVSTGSGAPITKQLASTANDFFSNTVRGGVTDARSLPPGGAADLVSIALTVPDGSGSFTTLTTAPSSAGVFTFSGVPIGRHRLRIINTPTADTLERNVTVTPRSSEIVTQQFGVVLW